MKKCKSCQSEIDDKAKKCPKCQADQRNWFAKHKIITIIFAFILIGIISGSGGNKANNSNTSSPSVSETIKNNDNNQQSPTAIVDDKPKETMSQKNAVRKAKSYIDMSGFSRSGLIKQLEFDKFTNEDAVYAVDSIGVDWNKQAEKKAKSYVDMSGFSRDSLIKQLEYEGFTNEEAIYGVNAIGL